MSEQREYDYTVREIHRLEEVVEQQRRWKHKKNKKTHTLDNTRKMIARLEESLVKPDKAPKSMRFSFKACEGGANEVLVAKNLGMKFGETPLFENVDIRINKREKVFLLGPNGCGKTTLIKKLLKEALNEFELKELNIMLPEYVSVLSDTNPIKKQILDTINNSSKKYNKYKEVENIKNSLIETKIFVDVKVELMDAASGVANITLDLDDKYFDDIIISFLGHMLEEKKELIEIIQEYTELKKGYSSIKRALDEVMATGYGISYPEVSEMKLLEPVVTEAGGRYGVKLKAIAPSIHMIRVDVESTFEPIIGSYEQSQTLINSLMENDDLSLVWNKEIFGRKLSELVNDGIKSKINLVPDKAKRKLQEALEKIVNTGSGGLIAIIL